MSDNRSLHELLYRRRWVEPRLAEAAAAHPVVVLTGARQTGKTTLLRHSESLAGRAVHFVLRPMTLGEMEGQGPSPILADLLAGRLPEEGRVGGGQDPLPHAIQGLMPALLTLPSPEAKVEWWESYVATYLERDLRDLSQVASLADFRGLIALSALRTGRLLNQTEVARDSGISRPTVHRYLNLLEVSFLIHRIPAYARSRTKRVLKTPKLYWADPGLAAFLMGIHSVEEAEKARESGPLFENLVFLHLQVLAELLRPRAQLYHWRTASGTEVDFVVEWGGKLVGVEAKLGPRAHYSDVKGLEVFVKEYPEARAGVLLYCGEEVIRLGERIVALPWSLLARA